VSKVIGRYLLRMEDDPLSKDYGREVLAGCSMKLKAPTTTTLKFLEGLQWP
jgi:hypothetical protein